MLRFNLFWRVEKSVSILVTARAATSNVNWSETIFYERAIRRLAKFFCGLFAELSVCFR